jgi:dynamin GTPase
MATLSILIDVSSCLTAVGTRTIGVLSKIDQAATDAKTVSCVQAILSNKGAPRAAADIEWVALIGQSVSIASAQSGSVGSDNSLETAWRAEAETLKSILTGAPQNKLGRIALVDTIAKQIRKRMKIRLPNLLSGYAFYADHLVFYLNNFVPSIEE